MKKTIRSVAVLFLVACLLATCLASVSAVEPDPKYTGLASINPMLTISSSSMATCHAQAVTAIGFSAELVLELQRNGETIKTWTNSGTGLITIDEVYYVAHGYDYVLKATAHVYDANGKWIESPTISTDPWEHY